MAEFLILKKGTYMDDYDSAKVVSLTLEYRLKYERRDMIGDIIEKRPDGYWTGKNAKGFNKNVFNLICVPDLEYDGKANSAVFNADGMLLKKRRYGFDVDRLVFVNNKITLTNPEFEVRLNDKIANIDVGLL